MRSDHEGDGKSYPASGGPAPGGSSDGRTAELSEDALLDTWAFAVSPYGLALDDYRFWRSTPREFAALKRQWAQHQATWHNGHFHQEVPFAPEDFIDPGGRARRKLQVKRDAREVAELNRKLEMMRPDDIDGVPPEWVATARGTN